MGVAFKCDRCGKYYDFYDGIKVDDEYINKNSISITKHDDSSNLIVRGAMQQLCPECMSEFNTFMNDLDICKRPLLKEIMDKLKADMSISYHVLADMSVYVPHAYNLIMNEKKNKKEEMKND